MLARCLPRCHLGGENEPISRGVRSQPRPWPVYAVSSTYGQAAQSHWRVDRRVRGLQLSQQSHQATRTLAQRTALVFDLYAASVTWCHRAGCSYFAPITLPLEDVETPEGVVA